MNDFFKKDYSFFELGIVWKMFFNVKEFNSILGIEWYWLVFVD